jgi:hypothetical protein
MKQRYSESFQAASSMDLMGKIQNTDFSDRAATVVGYGNIGKQHVQALRALGVGRIRVCSQSAVPMEELNGVEGVETVIGGFENMDRSPHPQELGVIATRTKLLVPAAERLAALGFHNLLIEKPVSLWSKDIFKLASDFERQGIDAICGYNRVANPSFHEVRSKTEREGGITSCTYTFTELIKAEWQEQYSPQELARWGILNSSHPISMAHALIGPPKDWAGHRSGGLAWHDSGSVFVGSGISDQAVPFSYHADWGSTGCWSVEVHTSISSYRLCPLETVLRRTSPFSEWEDVTIATSYPEVKVGLAEEISAMLDPEIRRSVPMFTLAESAALTKFSEEIFGYDSA